MVLDVNKNCFIEPQHIQNKLTTIFHSIWNSKYNTDNLKPTHLPQSLSKSKSSGRFSNINQDNFDQLKSDNLNLNSFKMFDKTTSSYKNVKFKSTENKLNNKFFKRDKSKEILKLNKKELCKTQNVPSLKSSQSVQKLFSNYRSDLNKDIHETMFTNLDDKDSDKVDHLIDEAFFRRD